METQQVGFAPIRVSPRTGAEPIHDESRPVGLTVLDFWRWSTSDLLSNAARGRLAEYLVAIALGKPEGVRAEWDAYDLMTSTGQKVEVKSAAYLQSWYHKKLSAITFGIRPTRSWSAQTNELEKSRLRQADLYVFAVLEHMDKATVDPLNVAQWRFYVLPTAILNTRCPTQKTIGLKRLLSLGPREAKFDQLGVAVATVGADLAGVSGQGHG